MTSVSLDIAHAPPALSQKAFWGTSRSPKFLDFYYFPPPPLLRPVYKAKFHSSPDQLSVLLLTSKSDLKKELVGNMNWKEEKKNNNNELYKKENRWSESLTGEWACVNMYVENDRGRMLLCPSFGTGWSSFYACLTYPPWNPYQSIARKERRFLLTPSPAVGSCWELHNPCAQLIFSAFCFAPFQIQPLPAFVSPVLLFFASGAGFGWELHNPGAQVILSVDEASVLCGSECCLLSFCNIYLLWFRAEFCPLQGGWGFRA